MSIFYETTICEIYYTLSKQELYLKQWPIELEKLVEIAKIQSTEASNAIEGIVTTNTRIRQLVKEKQRQRTVMSRKTRDIVMYGMLFTKVLMLFPSLRIILYAKVKHLFSNEWMLFYISPETMIEIIKSNGIIVIYAISPKNTKR